MPDRENLVEIVEKLSFIMNEYEDKILNSDELTNLTVNQINYIDVIERLKNPTFSQLAEELKVTKPTVTVAINKLVRQKYVKKIQSSEDRRVYHLVLTDKGTKVVNVHDQAHRGFARIILECLNKDETNQLEVIMQKVINCYNNLE